MFGQITLIIVVTILGVGIVLNGVIALIDLMDQVQSWRKEQRAKKRVRDTIESPEFVVSHVQHAVTTIEAASSECTWLPITCALSSLCFESPFWGLRRMGMDIGRFRQWYALLSEQRKLGHYIVVGPDSPKSPEEAYARAWRVAKQLLLVSDTIDGVWEQVSAVDTAEPALVAAVNADAVARIHALRDQLLALYPDLRKYTPKSVPVQSATLAPRAPVASSS